MSKRVLLSSGTGCRVTLTIRALSADTEALTGKNAPIARETTEAEAVTGKNAPIAREAVEDEPVTGKNARIARETT